MDHHETEVERLRSQIEQHEERISTVEKRISKLAEGQSEEDAIISSQSRSRLERDS